MAGVRSEISIRLALFKDSERIMDVISASIGAMREAGIEQWDDEYPTTDHIYNDVRGGGALLAIVNDVIAGYVATDEQQSPEWAEALWKTEVPVLCVHRLVVSPDHHRRGIATRLMNHVEQKAIDAGYRGIRLDAFTKNPAALAMYERRGYVEAGRVSFRKGRCVCFEKALV